MCWLSCFVLFWNTKYNTPRSFCLANYSDVFCDQCRVSAFAYLHQPLKLRTSPRVQPLGQIHYPFSYQLTGLVLLWSQHHLLLSICSGYPCGPVSRRSFHNIQRHCYNHRSYQWSDPHGPKQACLHEPLLADLCRHTSFGCVTTLILRNAGRTQRYRTINCPKYLL
jgi:hypothetical protein